MKLKFLVIILIFAIGYFIITYYTSSKNLEKEFIRKFSSEEDFKSYIIKSMEQTRASREIYGVGLMSYQVLETRVGESFKEMPERFSPTTTQVISIDEPDIVKTDGLRIYFSQRASSYRYWDLREEKMPTASPPIIPILKTKIIKAFPPEALSILSEINETGNLFITSNNLLILSDKIYGYDITNPESPTKKFTIELNGSIVGARLYENKVYIILRGRVDYHKPCPIVPLSINKRDLIIRCQEIYYPTNIIPVDVVYTAIILNPETGNVEKTISFIGSYSTVVYMSENAIYVTYEYQEDIFKLISKFIEDRCRDIIPSHILSRLKEIESYNISLYSKMIEYTLVIEKWKATLSEDELLRIENELNNRREKYFEEMKREIVKTGIVKIELENFVISATGFIPGRLLNQFSLDEYKDHLRVATTVGYGVKTENDVYVLDKDLKIVGSVKSLGLEERIYSVRFIGDRGYVVTFREIDPFYVLDLADPNKPEIKGELKIPGYSSYLHPIEEHLILGIGKEESRVKISLFDVSSASNPKEVSKYILDEYWSDVLRNHHAFLLDKKHEIFFIPASKGGYVFSYSNKNLELKKVIPSYYARRALYINDWLYIVTDSKIVVFDEFTWEKVSEIEF